MGNKSSSPTKEQVIKAPLYQEPPAEVIGASFSCILEGQLYLGNQLAAGHKCPLTVTMMKTDQVHENFDMHNIKNILCVTIVQDLYPEKYRYLSIPISDCSDYDILSKFQETFEFIESALQRQEAVFVHCQMGQSRSAAVTCAFLMRHKSWSFREAFDFMKAKRPLLSDEKFGVQLARYEDALKDSSS